MNIFAFSELAIESEAAAGAFVVVPKEMAHDNGWLNRYD